MTTRAARRPFRALVSYFYWTGRERHTSSGISIDGWLEQFVAPDLREGVDFFADSGGFSAHTLGVDIDVEDYARWIERERAHLSTVATLDVIGDAAATAENTRILRTLTDVPIIPAFHVNEPWSALEELLDNGEHYIALGGMVGKPQRALVAWATQCFRMAQGRAVFHGFGLTGVTALAALPWYSADSSSWVECTRRGRLTLREAGQAWPVPVLNARSTVALPKLRELWDDLLDRQTFALVRRRGFDPTLLYNAQHFADPARAGLVPHDDYSALVDLALDDIARFEAWCRSRHGEVRVPETPDAPPGLRLYAACCVDSYYMGNATRARLDHPDYPGPAPMPASIAAHMTGAPTDE